MKALNKKHGAPFCAGISRRRNKNTLKRTQQLILHTLANSSCCCLRSSSSGMPRFSSRELAFLLFRATVLHSCSTSFTSVMYDANPRLSKAAELLLFAREQDEMSPPLVAKQSRTQTGGGGMWWDGMGLTVDDVLRGYGLLVRLVAYFIGL